MFVEEPGILCCAARWSECSSCTTGKRLCPGCAITFPTSQEDTGEVDEVHGISGVVSQSRDNFESRNGVSSYS